ncbi:UN protein [Termitomyces sp. T112]|nr:UN protein [Termitomyces sp. T112]
MTGTLDSGASEKSYDTGNMHNASSDDGYPNKHERTSVIFPQPTGVKGLWYHPLTQAVLLGFVCFMCPGLFNALNGLGAGGQVDSTTSANANSTVYATFAVGAFFAGSVTNKIGAKRALLLGSTGYALYIGSFLVVNIHPKAGGFIIAAGAYLGFCAGLLWTAQGSLMLAYPTESQKGLFIGVFWAIFNLGAVVGASVSLGENFHSKANSVGNGTYVAFLVLTLIGVLIPLLMVDPNTMVRTDGTKVTAPRHPSWKLEIYGLWITLKTDPMILFLFPMFFASNWFYTWQFNEYNNALFNIRARSLNNLVYWLAQIIGSISIGFLLDQQNISRRTRAFSGWIILFVMVFVVHIWAYFYQKGYTRKSIPPDAQKMDIDDSGYTAKIMLYILCGLLDAMWQTTAYWIMGAMSNDPAKLAHFTGFYKSFQSAGGAGVWRADAVKTPFMNMFISTWALLVSGLVFALPMIFLRVKEHTDYSDEVLARMDDSGRIHVAAEMQAPTPTGDSVREVRTIKREQRSYP